MAGRLKRLLPPAAMALVALWLASPAAAQLPRNVGAELQGCDELDPAACLYPWPNDFFTVADRSTDTGRRVNLPLVGMPRNVTMKPIDPGDINQADGFSPGSMIITRVPGLDNAEAFRRTDPVPITDVERSFDPDAPIVVIDADSGARHLIWSELDSNPEADADRTLIVRPAVNFEEGHRYIVALRNLKDADGQTIPARGAFRAWRDKPNPHARGRRGHYEELFDTLGDAGIARDELYLAWDFTVAASAP